MAKKCEQCGAPAVDSQSLFCNLCGGCVRDDQEPSLPVCRTCGIPAPDDQSVFCTRCGLKYAAGPEDRYPVCSSCGSVVPDEQAVFCNRCGTKISGPEPAMPVTVSAAPVSGIQALLKTTKKTGSSTAKKTPGSVIVTQKKHSASPPAQQGEYVLDEPPADILHDRTEAPPDLQVQKKYAHLPLVADDGPVDIQPAKNQPAKKYAHLPLVADELKVKDSPQAGFFSNGTREPSSSHQKKHAPKNGIMGMFKR